MDFIWFFLGIAAVAAGLTYIKKSSQTTTKPSLMPSSANRPEKRRQSRFVCLKKRRAGVWTRPSASCWPPLPPNRKPPGPACSRWPISAFGHAAAFATVPSCW